MQSDSPDPAAPFPPAWARWGLLVLAIVVVLLVIVALTSSGHTDTSYAVALGGAAATAAAATRARKASSARAAEIVAESAEPPQARDEYDRQKAMLEARVAGMSEAEKLARLRGES